MNLIHCNTTPIFGTPKIKGNCGYGFYLAKSIKVAKTFGDIVTRYKVTPKNTLCFYDNEIKGKGFFNMDKITFDNYISLGYDSLAWYKNGKLQEFIALNTNILEIIY